MINVNEVSQSCQKSVMQSLSVAPGGLMSFLLFGKMGSKPELV